MIGGRKHFWQARYYDFNVYTQKKRIEKLRYMHRNPVKRELVSKPEDWIWSSFRRYATGQDGVVEIESEWTGRHRERMGMPLRVKIVGGPVRFGDNTKVPTRANEARMGHPQDCRLGHPPPS